MITIELLERSPDIKVTNDKTFGEVLIACRDYNEEKETLINLVERLLQNND